LPNIAGVLREEIRRLARKETKAAVLPLRKLTRALQRRVAEQKRRLAELERAAKRIGRTAGPAAAKESGEGPRARFSPKWMRVHRKKLGMSRLAYSKLLGVSAQSVMGWEHGQKRPRQATVETWSRVRKMGARQARALLASMKSTAKRRGRKRRRARGRRR
jgi:DNA-binding transcriptional regulator YiaG